MLEDRLKALQLARAPDELELFAVARHAHRSSIGTRAQGRRALRTAARSGGVVMRCDREPETASVSSLSLNQADLGARRNARALTRSEARSPARAAPLSPRDTARRAPRARARFPRPPR